MAAKAVKLARKLERPRPLKVITEGLTKSPSSPSPGTPASADSTLSNKNITATVDDVIQELEILHVNISNGNFDDKTQSMIAKICVQLKSKGQQLEAAYKEQLDHYFVTLRNASRDDRVDMLSRLRLLEVIELRAMMWKANENLANYYKRKFLELEGPDQFVSTPTSATPPYLNQVSLSPISPTHQSPVILGPGEVLKTSGKFAKPTKIPGKNYYKDEIVIRNSDSGKVNPGARDRLVQITGPHEDAIIRGKALIEDTIRRNASPVRERSDSSEIKGSSSASSMSNSTISEDAGNIQSASTFKKPQLVHSYSMSDASVGEYSYTIVVGRNTIKVSSTQVDLVRTAKLVLEEYFAGQAELAEKLSQHGSVPFYSTTAECQPPGSRRPLSMFSDYSSYSQDTGHWEFGGHVVASPSYTSSSLKSSPLWFCNGGHAEVVARESSPCSTTSSEEGTYKEGSLTDDDRSSSSKDVSPLCFRGIRSQGHTVPSYPQMSRGSWSKLQKTQSVCEHRSDASHSTNRHTSALQQSSSKGTVVSSVQLHVKAAAGETPVIRPASLQLGANEVLCSVQNKQEVNEHAPVTSHQRRGMFATTVVSSSQKPESENQQTTPTTTSSTTRRFSACNADVRIAYTRDFLLRCAKSPLSQATPDDYQQIIKKVPSLLKENPKMFDPTAYMAESPIAKSLENVQFDSTLASSQQSQESWPAESIS